MSHVASFVVLYLAVRLLYRLVVAVRKSPSPSAPTSPVSMPADPVLDRLTALAYPMASARIGPVFTSAQPLADTAELERTMRPALLHLFKLRNDMSLEQIRSAVSEQLRTRWFRIDLDRLAATDDLRDAMAFACARVTFAVRVSGLLGWIDDETQRRVLSQNAQRAAWARGRRQWIGSARADSLGIAFEPHQVAAWVSDLQHPWARLPWGMPALAPA